MQNAHIRNWYLVLRIDGAHWYYSFHCTPLTYLFCGGVVGLAAYLYHRYKTVRIVFSAKLTSERVFVALTMLAMLCNALLDIAMTSPTHLLYYGIMLALMECDVRKIKSKSAVQTTVKQFEKESNIVNLEISSDGEINTENHIEELNNERV